MAKIEKALPNEKSSVMLSDLYPEPWTHVCFTTQYDRARRGAKDAFGISPDEAVVINGKDDFAFESTWLVTFYRPPNQMIIFQVPIDRYSDGRGDCQERDVAALGLYDNNVNDRPHLTLFNIKKGNEYGRGKSKDISEDIK